MQAYICYLGGIRRKFEAMETENNINNHELIIEVITWTALIAIVLY
ncbi:hypothetical protein [Dawidia soli]|uniref:Uncharacterized protein n=1 Tax=Dawidia soli TaxID=2782352 RepID=A0AAP2DDE9_9BACT|nr:hypothetical protein [Dawidia soli]MBT1689984.1 hypothetical protein [Dawidia soli]